MSFTPSNSIAALKPYFFANLGAKIADLTESGVDIVRLDIGSPDMPPAAFIIDALVERVRQPGVHGYTSFGGTPAYRQAIAAYYSRRFGVELDPKKNVVGLIGSKEGIFTLNQVMLNPGEILLVPDPGYGTYRISAQIAGAQVYKMPLLEENGYLPDLDIIPPEIAKKSKLMWLNYPNNPTGAVADTGFFTEVIAFAKKYNILIAHDSPYVDVCYGDYMAPSILEVPGAMDYAVEFSSASKVYNMAGWRLGAAVGNPEVIRYIETYKSQKDTSHFEPIMYAGGTALVGDQEWVRERNKIYEKRMTLIANGLKEMGFEPTSPKATLYAWTRVPGGMDDITFCDRLLIEAGVSTTPGSVFGENGRGFFRMTICIEEDQIREAMSRMLAWMKKEGYG